MAAIGHASESKTVGNGRAQARMAILAGIDEAGFGPLLGPLVVSSAAFSVEPALLAADLWETLVKSVSRSRKHLGGRLLIADSKKAFNREEGLGHLERTSLIALDCMGRRPAELTDCCRRCAGLPASVAEYPLVPRHARVPTGGCVGRSADRGEGLL
jgi:hypothetical protein